MHVSKSYTIGNFLKSKHLNIISILMCCHTLNQFHLVLCKMVRLEFVSERLNYQVFTVNPMFLIEVLHIYIYLV